MLRSKPGKKSIRAASDFALQALEKRQHLTAVTGHAPYNGQQSVGVSSNITVTFDVAMNASTLNGNTLQLRDSSNAPIPASFSYNSTTRTITLDPTSNLAATNNYFYVRVLGGANGVKDSNGNAMSADYNFSFTTGKPTFNESTVFSGLIQPTAIEFSPDRRIFVAEQRGIIKVFDSVNDTTPDIFADLRTNVHNYWDRGLLGMALHPNFPATPYVYVLYAYDAPIGGTAPTWGSVNGDSDPGPGTTGNGPAVSGRLSRLTASGNFMTGNETVLVNDWGQQYPSHSIGHLQFGPDGYLYASAGDGASFSAVDYGQNNLLGDPANEGGAVRSLDILTSSDPTGLDGSIIRIDPNTGTGVASNPFASSSDANNKRIIAYGLRNPFRFNFRPGSNEIWVGDVGWNTWEEINRITNVGDSAAENFGWPAYEGPNKQSGYDAANLPLLESLYTQNVDIKPYYAYQHSAQIVSGSGEPTGGSSVTGIAFYEGGTYPAAYDGAMFFADYSRKHVYVMYKGANGLPDVNTRQVFKALTNGAVELQTGPNGDLFYVDLAGGRIQRFTFNGNNTAPTASIVTTATSGAVPLFVSFDGSGSSDPDPGEILTYSWDLNGDGAFGDSTSPAASYTYTNPGTYNVKLRVTDRTGTSTATSVNITAGQAPNTAPTPTINTPLSTSNWKVGDAISFSGGATDIEDGTLAASRLKWDLVLIHGNEIDPNSTHDHLIQSYNGVASGSFVAPDHEYPSWLELRLTATDSAGLSTTITRRLDPQTVTLNFASNPAGMELAFNGTIYAAPFTRTVIAGSTSSISAINPQTINGVDYYFTGWSDGGNRSHQITVGTQNLTYTATFGTQSPFLITPFLVGQRIEAEYFDNGGNSQAYRDITPGNAGGAYRSSDVDIEVTGDIDGNYNVGWAESGEWLEYTLDVAQAGYYVFEARVACPADYGTFHVEFDGVNKTGTLNMPNTGAWQDWTTIGKVVQLSAGVQVMRVAMDLNSIFGSVGNFNWFRLTAYTPLSAPTNVSATALNTSQIRLNWQDNSADETGFKIERKAGLNGAWQQIAQTMADATTLLDTGLTANVTYYYRIRATDGTNNGAYSLEANASTSSSQTPYLGVPFSTGSIIEAENYDVGGQGVSYNDLTTGNTGGQHRPEDVDIENTSDTGGGKSIGWADEGEWLEYTVYVPAAGTYLFEARVASLGSNGIIHVEFDGIDKSGPIAVPNTGGWQNWQTISRLLTLPAGIQTMRVVMEANSTFGSAGNFNWFKLSPSGIASGDGLMATYYNNPDFTGSTLTRIDPRIDFNWNLGSPATNIAPGTYSARWLGKVKPEYSETYTFFTRTDDGVRLWVNGQLLIDRWVDQATAEYSGSINLVAGQMYDIKMEYYQNGGGATARLLWSSPSVSKQIIPQANLFSAAAAPAGIVIQGSPFSGSTIYGPTQYRQPGTSVLDELYGIE